MKQRQQLLFEARRHLGMSGRPNKATEWYAGRHGSGFLRAAWCGMFVSWIAYRCGLTQQVGEFAYTPYWVDWFKRQGRWGRKPQKGAIVFFNWRSSRSRPWPTAEHVGIVQAVREDGMLYTVEGNADDSSGRRLRDPKYVIGYGYPAFSDEQPPKPTPGPPAYPGRLIEPGDTGNVVRKVKARLIKLGYKEVKRGPTYGPRAVTAIKKFQKARGLQVDGIVGPKTWKELFR